MVRIKKKILERGYSSNPVPSKKRLPKKTPKNIKYKPGQALPSRKVKKNNVIIRAKAKTAVDTNTIGSNRRRSKMATYGAALRDGNHDPRTKAKVTQESGTSQRTDNFKLSDPHKTRAQTT